MGVRDIVSSMLNNQRNITMEQHFVQYVIRYLPNITNAQSLVPKNVSVRRKMHKDASGTKRIVRRTTRIVASIAKKLVVSLNASTTKRIVRR